MTPADLADLDNDLLPTTERRNAFTPAQSRHYFRIVNLYGSPRGPLAAQALRSMMRLYKAAGKSWWGSAPELTCKGPLEMALSVQPVRLMMRQAS